MMNKILLIGILLIAMIGISIAGEGISQLMAKNIEITYSKDKSPTTLTTADMIDFNGVNYEVKGNTITLNKQDVFNNRTITFTEEQTCLALKEPTCLKMLEPICSKFEPRPKSTCLKYAERDFCEEWEKIEGCKEFNPKEGTCTTWENKPKCLTWTKPICEKMNESTCSSWTNHPKEYFIKQAIQKEIEFVKSVQIEKAKMVVADTNAFGKVIIK